ncbi:hypothetical protein H9Y04_45445 [Streptomyces sp. TRM66268-LWL]|uniref:Uncharacterized protein n=1 Tax=Streptomyces polyasparticus TaxID=2767826 RepID=A0ABR7SZM6_9ACTN|nr:hypothetical protein [Streptomyces polyasparticus]MBC9719723.1 hypothetical protein [Streptomyces polyasparticus]
MLTMLLAVLLGGLLPGAGVWAGGLGLTAWGIGLCALRNHWRMRRVLRAHPWVACTAAVRPSVWSGPSVVLRAPTNDSVFVRSVVAVRQRWHLAEPDARGRLWWCGDASGGGVLMRPSGGDLLWARDVGTARAQRESGAAIAAALLQRPAAVQPFGEGSAPAGTGAVPVWVQGGGRAPVRWRLLTGLAAAGLAVLGVSVAGAVSMASDPWMPLITDSGPDSEGRCSAWWKDPITDAEHTGEVACSESLLDEATGEFSLRAMDGWQVAHGPFKGDIYNADFEGTNAFTTYAIGMLAGGLVLLGSAGTLAVRGIGAVRHRNAPTTPAPGVPQEHRPRVSLVKAHDQDRRYDWAELSAAAAEQALAQPTAPSTYPPATSDRATAWWRVRPLLEMAGMRQLAVSAFAFAGVLVVFMVASSGSWMIVALMCGMFLAAAARTLRASRIVRTLAKDAARQPQQTGRYVLLRENATHAPWALYFPIGDDTPFAAQPLFAQQPLPGPSGEVLLHGTADQLDIRVPWIEGRPVWPAGDYILLGADLDEDRTFFDALIPD